jgi:hypothetical protein
MLLVVIAIANIDGETVMAIFSEVVDAADCLSIEEQEELLAIVRRRLAERRRAELVRDVQDARAKFAAGAGRAASVDEIMDEASAEILEAGDRD